MSKIRARRVKLRGNLKTGKAEIQCVFCGRWRPLLEDRKGSHYYRCRMCDVMVFIYNNGLVVEQLKVKKVVGG